MALGDSQDLSWAARGWEAMSFFVCFLYSSKAAVKMVPKVVDSDDGSGDGTRDIVLVEGE